MSVERADADIAKAHRLADMVAAAMDLQRDRAARRKAPLVIDEIEETDFVDPGDDMRWVAGDARADAVPALRLPETRPRLRLHRQGEGGGQLADMGGIGGKLEILDEETAGQRLAIEAGDRAAGIVVERHLIGGALLAAAQEEAAIDAEIDP